MLSFVKFKLHYWPIVSCIWCISTFIITYIVSVYNGHVYPFFPYISDTGTKPPESCIFSQMLNIETVLLGVTIYLRYKQVEIATSFTENIIKPSWNNFSVPLGFVSCLGIGIVGNFQETNVLSVHLLGAFMIFGVGVLYFLMQARITIAFGNATGTTYHAKKWLVHLRVFIAVCLVPLFLITSICSTVSAQQFTGKSIEYWTREDGGFTLRLFGTFTEWIAVTLMMIFVSTFSVEFKQIKFKSISFKNVI